MLRLIYIYVFVVLILFCFLFGFCCSCCCLGFLFFGLFVCSFVCFWNRVSMCSLGCPKTHCSEQAGLKLLRSTYSCFPNTGIKGMLFYSQGLCLNKKIKSVWDKSDKKKCLTIPPESAHLWPKDSEVIPPSFCFLPHSFIDNRIAPSQGWCSTHKVTKDGWSWFLILSVCSKTKVSC